MALATIPASSPAPNPLINAYERTTQSFFFNAVTANQPQVGQGAPAAAKQYAMVGVVSRGQLPYNLVVQVDISGSGALAAGNTITLLGSLDGVNYYSIGSIVIPAGATGGIFPFSGILARYITASLTGYAAASGAPAITASFSA